MAVDPALKELMVANVATVVVAASATDFYGGKTWGAATQMTGYRSDSPRKVREESGEEVVAATTLWLDQDYGVTVNSQVTLPDGTTPPVLGVENLYDEDGTVETQVVHLGRTGGVDN